MGFALSRVATCTVAATGRFINERKTDWLFGLLVVASWSAILLFMLVIFSGWAHVPVEVHLGWPLFLGAALMGIGAVLNQGCFIGTISKIGTGQFGYLISFVGLALAVALDLGGFLSTLDANFVKERSPLSDSIVKQTMLAGSFLIAAISLWQLLQRKAKSMFPLIIVGLSGALIFGLSPEWTYGSTIARFSRGIAFSNNLAIEMAVIALFAGSICSAMLRDKFHPTWGNMQSAFMHLAGGFLMGIGVRAIPGGNDVLLLWVIPGLALHGVIAYAAMVATIAASLSAMKALRR